MGQSHYNLDMCSQHECIVETPWHRHGESMGVLHREKRAAKLMTPAIYDCIRQNLLKCG